MTIAKGLSFGPYEILSRIGEGGMGEVWRARDKRIGRDVAVKVLPDEFNDEAVKRFEQEARTAGALNHPGLITIFDVGTTEGSPYIVMELLEGQTLRDVIGDAPPPRLPLRKAIEYAIQIAEALAVAHEKGIIHRDLKPENLFVTSDRRVKILDFGLAKLAADAKDADGRIRSEKHLTAAGITVGTPAYMSPEQVRAAGIDHRTDIFALGVVLYEMLCGRSPFERISAVETMYAVLNDEPAPLDTIVPNVPAALDAIVRHCLEKDPRERFQSARDLAFQLRMLPEQNGATGSRQQLPLAKPRLRAGMLILPLVLAAAAAGWAVRGFRGREPAASLPMFRQLTFADGMEMLPSLSPDGTSFAYVSWQSGNGDIWVQRVDGRGAVNVTSDSPDDDDEPAFSPDGSHIAFHSYREGGGIFVMGVTGESVRRLTNLGRNPAWSPDGNRIVYSTLGVALRPYSHQAQGDLWIVDARTGAKRLLFDHRSKGAESDAMQPSWSPHGKRVAFWGVSHPGGQRHIWTIDPDAPAPMQTLVRVTSDPSLHWNPVWSPDGRHLYFGSDRNGTVNLWRVAMDEGSGKPVAPPELVTLPGVINGNFTISQQGDIAFASLTRSCRLLALPFDPRSGKTGEPRTLFGGSEQIADFEPSPDGKAVAFTTEAGAQEDLFVANIDGTRMRQLTKDPARDRGVTWAPDGKTLYFFSNRGGSYQIWSVRSDGSLLGPVTDDRDLQRVGARLVRTPRAAPDGRTLVAQTDRGTVFVHLDRPIGQRLEALPKEIADPSWSPDGKLLLGGGGAAPPVVVYSPGTRRFTEVPVAGTPQWLPDSRHVALFDYETISILDLDSHGVTPAPFPSLPGVYLPGAIVSHDGSLLYIRQTLEESDIWIMRAEPETPPSAD